ncbi:hypothetical protein G3T36_02135 [Diaminobutyricibacter tongyongensis]|uniref:Uncharacterized protein n=1 Tax=Leifsonia tongyongensis TaxID=1268043 RepID=A0A6L9XTC8_9MICO|nr:hypothetical protein [Diaminobutyricibacter tongyongensis]NEN04660.1 hypothetical protein [Diaminobutyricibacter tongyongensis]
MSISHRSRDFLSWRRARRPGAQDVGGYDRKREDRRSKIIGVGIWALVGFAVLVTIVASQAHAY